MGHVDPEWLRHLHSTDCHVRGMHSHAVLLPALDIPLAGKPAFWNPHSRHQRGINLLSFRLCLSGVRENCRAPR